MSRPVCVHCGKPHGSRITRNEDFKWPVGAPKPEYRGNLMVTKTTTWGIGAHRVGFFTLWDGESWSTPYDPFCTLRCALDYARKAYNQRQLRRVS